MKRTMYILQREDGKFYWKGDGSSRWGYVDDFENAYLFKSEKNAKSRMGYGCDQMQCAVREVSVIFNEETAETPSTPLDVVAIPFNYLPCSLKIFTIRGKDASEEDFGTNADVAPENAEAYCCGCHKFTPYDRPSDGVLSKYHITKDEYKKVCDILEKVLYVGSCGWCS